MTSNAVSRLGEVFTTGKNRSTRRRADDDWRLAV